MEPIAITSMELHYIQDHVIIQWWFRNYVKSVSKESVPHGQPENQV